MKKILFFNFSLALAIGFTACHKGDTVPAGAGICGNCAGANAYNFDWPDQDAHQESIANAACAQFDISGNGAITIFGAADRLCWVQSGNGAVNASNFKVKNASISISGNGAMTFFVTDSFNIVHYGSGAIRYKGNPDYKNILIKGSGSVNPF